MAKLDPRFRDTFAFWDATFLAAVHGFTRRKEYRNTFPIDLVEDAAAIATTAVEVRLRTQRELADTLDLDGRVERP